MTAATRKPARKNAAIALFEKMVAALDRLIGCDAIGRQAARPARAADAGALVGIWV